MHFNYDIKSRARLEAQRANAQARGDEEVREGQNHNWTNGPESEGDRLSAPRVVRIALQIKRDDMGRAGSET